MESKLEELVLAVTTVPGFTKACQRNGDDATFIQLSEYYTSLTDAVANADGRVIKVMGDAVLMTFSVEDCYRAVESLREFQKNASEHWRSFDQACHVQIKVGVGPVVCGELGPPGEERFDVIGDALNQLVKAPWGDFELMPEVSALVQSQK